MGDRALILATRGSALALTQSRTVLAQCRALNPGLRFELNVIKTTGDKLQTASLANLNLPKGLFTKELETALLDGSADLAVHSLKDLPTDLPPGLALGAVSRRADVRDVLIYRKAAATRPHLRTLDDLDQHAIVATSSNRRRAQLLERRPDLRVIPVRGNVPTRLRKLAEGRQEVEAIVLAAAGLERLGYAIREDGSLKGDEVPEGLYGVPLPVEEILPCVGQAALAVEIRSPDPQMEAVCATLNDHSTHQCVLAERAFLKAMGGGCQLAVGAYADLDQGQLRLRAVSFLQEKARRAEARGRIEEPAELGKRVADELLQGG